ncbi:Whirly transcription factor [uncultured archaeon]|nr:Whirly transcription factor [uncultured archaeon]
MKKITFYRANKMIKGTAISFDFNKEKESVFMEIASQKEEKAFDWEKRITMKLSVTDISKIIYCIEQRKDVQIFHDPNKNEFAQTKTDTAKNTSFNISVLETGFNFKIGEQGKDGTLNSKMINLSNDEAITLKILLTKAIEKIFDW